MIANVNSGSLSGSFSPRIMELKQKIHDNDYVDYAVQRIAQVLSRRIVEDSEQIYSGRKNGKK